MKKRKHHSLYLNSICILSKIYICRFPFDTKAPIGYLMAYIFQCIVFWLNFLFSLSLVCFGIASFLYGIALAKFLRINLHVINKNAKVKTNRLVAINALTEFFELQSAQKQLSSFVFYKKSFENLVFHLFNFF